MKIKNILQLKNWLTLFVLLSIAATTQAQTTVLNNGLLRLGNGSENSINSLGNTQQPFYFNGTLNVWRQLTYSNYPLDNAIAVGGDKTNTWNINGTVSINPALTSQVIDNSNYIVTSSSTGYGSVKSTGNVNIGGKNLRIEQTYTLPQSAGYLSIKVKVTNLDATLAENVRVWVGTRDDWVGNLDGPRKQRGNINTGSFVQNTLSTQQAQALQISTPTEAVIVFTNSTRGYTSVNNCCSFINAVNQNPSTSTNDVSNDGSYAFYVRMNDLAQNQSDEFTWYYAAGSLANIGTIINQVAQASGSVQNITCASATYNATSTANGTGYFMVVPQGSAVPTAAQIKAGVAYGSVTPVTVGSGAMTANTQNSFNFSGLSPNVNYTVYFVHEDAVPQFSAVINSNFSSASLPLAIITPSGSTSINTGGSVILNASTGSGYTYQWSLNGNPISGATSASYSANSAGSYTVLVTNANSCAVTSTATIVVVNASALSFDGVNDQVSVSGINIANQSFTYECWAKSDVSNRDNVIAGQGPQVNNNGLHIGFRSNNVFTFAFFFNDLNTTATYTDNAWHHWACVYSTTAGGNTRSIYRDGVLVAQDFPTTNFGGSGTFYIGRHDWGANFAGNIDEVRIWNRALCMGEILNNMNCELNPTGQTGLLALYNFNQGIVLANNASINTLTDASGNSRTGTLSGFNLNGSSSNWVAPGGVTTGTTCTTFAPPLATITPVGSTTVCAGLSVVLNANTGTGLTYQWRLNGNIISGATAASYTANASGSYTVVVTKDGCSTTSSATAVTINSLTIATIATPSTTILCAGSAIVLNANTGSGLAYQWRLNGNPISGATNSMYIANAAGNYTVVVTQNGCSTTSIPLVISPDQTPPIALCKDANLILDATGNASIIVPATTSTLIYEDWTGDNSGYYSVSNPNYPNNTLNWNLLSGDIDRADYIAGMSGPEIDLAGFGNSVIESKQTFNFTPGTYTFSFQQIANSLGGNGVKVEIGSLFNQNFISTLSITSESATFTVTSNTSATIKLTQLGPSDALGSFIGHIRLVRNISATLAIENGSSDNCSIASITASKTNFNCSDIGANTVTLTVTDINGNVSTCQSTVNVTDNIAPVISNCPADISVTATSAAGAIIYYTNPTSFDVCPTTLSLTAGLASGSTFSIGTTLVTYTATDAGGNTATCSFTVLVTGFPPVIVSPGTITVNTTAGLCSGVATYAATETTGVPASTITYSIAPGSTFNVGATQVTATATNEVGSSSVTFNVVVTDNQLPTAACKNVNVVLDASGTGTISILASTTNLFYEDWSGESGGYYTSSREPINWNLTGDADIGNVINAMPGFEIDLAGYANGIIETKQTFSFTPGSYTISFQQAGLVLGNSVRLDIGSLLSQTFVTGTTITSESATFTVTSNSSAKLKFTQLGPSDPSGTSLGQIRLVRNVSATLAIENGSTDNCSIASITASKTNFTCSDIGTNTVTLTVTDVNGNIGTCQSTVTVIDNIAPVISSCPSNITLNATSAAGAAVNYTTPTATDVCPVVVSLTAGLASGSIFPIGTTTVTHTATDAGGNSVTCSFTVTVSGLAPAIVSPGTINVNTTAGLCSGLATFTATETTGIPASTITYSIAPGSVFNVGTTHVIATATNPVGTSSVTFDVVVTDAEAPVATAQNVTVQLDATGNGSTTAVAVNNGSSDACGIATLSLSKTSFDCSNVGANTVTLTVTDVNGNVSTTDAVVTVVDGIAPVATAQNVIVQLDATGNGSTTAVAVNNGSSDACGIANLSLSKTSFDCSNVGANTVTLTVTDVNGNVSTTDAVVTVVDGIAPVATAQNVTVQLDATGNGSTTAVAVNNGSSDACGIANLSLSKTSFDCSNVGANTVTLTVTDVNGNVSTTDAVVTVVDGIAPVATAQNVTVQLDATGNGSTTAVAVNNGSSDACGIANLSLSKTSFDCSNVGANTVTLTVTDVNGNVSTTDAVVTVVDGIAPVATAQNVTVQLDATGNGSTTAVAVNNGSSDACGIANLSLSKTSFDCSNVGANTVTLTVTDVNGNVSTTNAVVTVVDGIAPVATAQNVTVQLDATGNGSTTAVAVNNGSSDACGIANLSLSKTSFDCSNVGANTVTLTVTDVNGNVSTTDAVVTVVDGIAPVATAQNVTVQLDATGNGSTTAVAVNNGSSDACGIANLSLSKTSFDCSNVGANLVTLTVTDVNGNVSTTDAVVTVVDGIAPVATAQNVTVQLDATGNGSTTAVAVNNGSSDACGIANLSLSKTSFDCSNVGANTVTLTVTDVNGNVSTTDAVVTVVDGIAPVATAQNVIVQLDATGNGSTTAVAVNNGSSDACGIANLSLSKTSFDCSNVGANTVTLTVTDVNGNVSTTDAVVTVVDGIAPVATAQNVTVQLDATGNGSTTAVAVNNGSSDACGIANLSLSKTSFDCSNVGANTVTLTVTDVNGNVSTTNAVVTVVDGIAPVATAQNVTVQLDATGNGSTTAVAVNNGSSDACGIANLSLSKTSFDCSNVGANTVTLTVTDVNGNVSTTDAVVTVVDGIAPVATAQNVTVQLDSSGNSSTTADAVNNGSSDACGIEALSLSKTSFDCSNVGANTVTLTVTDVNGNVSTTDAVVTVVDGIAPVAIAQNVTVTLSEGTASITAEQVNNGSFDNCTIETISVFPNTFSCLNIGLNMVTLTVRDVNGNESIATAMVSVLGAIPTATISQGVQPGFTQGGAIVLTASSPTATIFNWSAGPATATNYVYASGTYMVTATNSFGCSVSASSVVAYTASDLLSSYVIIGKKEVELKDHVVVYNGGVAATSSCGEIEVESYSTITAAGTFARAKKVEVKSNSTVTTKVLTALPTTVLPAFLSNPYCNSNNNCNHSHHSSCSNNNNGCGNSYNNSRCNNTHHNSCSGNGNNSNNNKNIAQNASVTITDSIMGTVVIGKNATVIFTSSKLYIKDLEIKEGANVQFSECTVIRVCNHLKIQKNANINTTNSKIVTAYVEKKFDVDEGASVVGNVYSLEDIKIKGKSSNPTTMTGLYIGDEVKAEKYVSFYWNTSTTCTAGFNKTAIAANEADLITNYFDVNVYPNPTAGSFNVRLFSSSSEPFTVTVYDMNGRLVESATITESTLNSEMGAEYADGMYIVKIAQSDNTKTLRLVRAKQ